MLQNLGIISIHFALQRAWQEIFFYGINKRIKPSFLTIVGVPEDKLFAVQISLIFWPTVLNFDQRLQIYLRLTTISVQFFSCHKRYTFHENWLLTLKLIYLALANRDNGLHIPFCALTFAY